MKFRQVLLARAIRQTAAIGTGAPRMDAVNRIKERYQFMKAPQQYEELYPNPILHMQQAITFQGGRFTIDKREVAVLQMQFLPTMIVVDTHSSTDDSDAVIDDYIAMINSSRPEAITEMGPRFYVSHVELSLERDPEMPPEYVDAAKTIDRFLSDYGESVPKFGFWGINLNLDPQKVAGIAPAFFALERRVNFPTSAKIFFSQAPLKTKDHITLLEKLERTLH